MTVIAMLRLWLCGLFPLVCLSGCSPRFNWREVRADDAYVATFPARVEHQTQDVELGQQRAPMTMTGAEVDHISFVIGVMEPKPKPGVQPATPAMLALALAKNLDVDAPALMPVRVRVAQSKDTADAWLFHCTSAHTEIYGEALERSGRLIEILVAAPPAAFRDADVLLAKDTFFQSVELN